MKTAYVSYVKQFNDFKLELSPSSNGHHFYMTIYTIGKPYFFSSDYILYPNFIERLFGVTAESKLARYEKKLFRELLRKMDTPDLRVTQAIANFLETK